LVQISLLGQVMHAFFTPHPRSTGLQPVTRPASSNSAHDVCWVQQPPSSHTSLVLHVPQLSAGPQPLFTEPQVARPHDGGVHAVHTPLMHSWAPVQVDGQVTLPLPQEFPVVPQSAPPASAGVHSGGASPHTPPMHDFPVGQVQPMVWPQPSLTVPQSAVCALGAQVSGAHASIADASGTPPSATTHWLAMQSSPVGQPPQAMATPQESRPTTPQLPVGQVFGLHDCDVGSFGSAVQTCPEGHAAPHAKIAPEHGSL
jgi:hypothetical protein